jgi:hypothetical protein
LAWQGGLAWQGAIDEGTLAMLPGLAWQGSRFLLGLITPTVPPDTITPFNVANFPSIQYVEGPTYSFYKILNPAPGIWRLHVNGGNTDPEPPHPETIVLSLATITDVTMQVTFNKSNYAIGETVVVQATLSHGGSTPIDEHTSGGGPITDATVQATVTPPGSSTSQTIQLLHSGGGVYTALFTNTADAGSYRFFVTAAGTVPGTLEPFNRHKEQSVFVSPPFTPSAVLLGKKSVSIDQNARIVSGSILVNEANNACDAELQIGCGVTTPSRYTLKASRIRIAAGATIGGDVYFNHLTNAGVINGTLNTPLTLPVVPALPPFESANPGSQNINLGNGLTGTLAPGRYRDVTLQPLSTLTLTGGVYDIKNVWVKSGARLVLSNASHVRVRYGFSAENGSVVGPAQGSSINAADVVVYVGGTDSQSPFSKAVVVGPWANVAANIYAPNGTLWLNDNSRATGAFIAKEILVGKNVQLTLASAFVGLAKGSAGSQQASEALDVPETFDLEQNFPNPFNPTTTIRYQLAEPRQVRLTIYNILGQVVRTLVNDVQPAGWYELQWDGTNDHGNPVSSGVLFCRLQAGDFVSHRKMMMLK